jgi:hypothetical protein
MENCNAFTTWRIGGSVRKQPRRDAVNRPRVESYRATAATAMEKPLGGKVQNQTFPPSLQIAQKTRDSHFPTAATTAGLGLHSPCLDGRPQGYILKWLDASRRWVEEEDGPVNARRGDLSPATDTMRSNIW